ncbi:MAG: NADH-quinone oxidoreductase subunit [Gaiellaceae bacterium]|nr:NADH-quinone oxidoreductase subunit [Gaiellaceae bacterium]
MTAIGVGAWLCLLAPLAGAALITLGGNLIPRRGAGLLATASTAVAFVGAVLCFFGLHASNSTEHNLRAWTWLSTGLGYKTSLGLLIDPLSVLMMLIVAGVGSLIVAYSVGYMHGENEERRYFAYMALFVFSMLLLVMGGNLLLLLAGWGMVGLSSYLLIGFYQDRPSAIAAAKKAFVMNAFGDATMALALFLLIWKVPGHSLSYVVSGDAWPGIGPNGWVANLVALGLLGGALAKSAQLPLQTWLPDAMEGPTPVSALIHAATMVTAGVYLIARTHVLFALAPHVAQLAAGLGAATLVMAGLIALVQTDIKRVIAYSTMSQIGYMFLAAGIGAYANGMFHLMTHAFFKALLFLASGIVIHALAGEQDIRQMGGLRKLMPFTWLCFWIGGLALVGIPPFAGFFSKDSILAAALDAGTYGYVLFAAGLAGAFLTGVYTFRMIFLVFGGEKSAFVSEHFHPHGGKEGPPWMVLPVAVLALLSVVGGFLQFAPAWHPLTDWLEGPARTTAEATNTAELVASTAAVLLGLAGMGVAWAIYVAKKRPAPRSLPLLQNLFYFDRAYDVVFYRASDLVATLLRRGVEEPVVLASGDLVGDATLRTGRESTVLQTGLLRTYILALAVGVSVLVVVFLAVR